MSSYQSEFDDLIRRLESEKTAILDRLRETEVSVGDSQAVIYDESFADQHEISQFGRMNYEHGGFKFHATPREFAKDSKFTFSERNLMSWVDSYVDGGPVDVDFKRFTALPEQPKLKKRDASFVDHDRCEHALMKTLEDMHRPITMVNPSFTSLWHLLKHGGGYVWAEGVDTDPWIKELQVFCQEHKLLKFVRRIPEGTICYLGTHTPSMIPDGDWVYLLPNPYSNALPYETYYLEEGRGGVSFHYRTKRDKVSYFDDSMDCYVYNPTAVGTDTSDPYFVVSSFPMGYVTMNVKVLPHTPWFLDDLPEYITEGEWEVSRKGNIVYDVQGEGTYLSRRHRIELDEGDQWAPLRRSGEWAVTRMCDTPFHMACHVDWGSSLSPVTIFGDTVDCQTRVESYTNYELPEGDRMWVVPEGHPNSYPTRSGHYYTIAGESPHADARPVEKPIEIMGSVDGLDLMLGRVLLYRPPTKIQGQVTDEELYDVPSFVMRDQVVVPRTQPFFRGPCYLFRDRSLINQYRLYSVMYSGRWSNLYQGRQSVDFPVKHYKVERIVDKVHRFLQKYPIYEWTDRGATFRDLYESNLQLCEGALRALLLLREGLVQWGLTYVHLDFIYLRFPGQEEVVHGEDAHGRDISYFKIILDGKTFTEVYRWISVRTRCALIYTSSDVTQEFLRVLEKNGFFVAMARKQLIGEGRCSVPIYTSKSR
jgi:hypothetical protein